MALNSNPAIPSIPSTEFVGRWTRKDFAYYLENTLIPDLKESGHAATAEDFEVAVSFMKETVILPAPASLAEEKCGNAIRFLRKCKLVVNLGELTQGSKTWDRKEQAVYIEPDAHVGFHWVQLLRTKEKLSVSEDQIEISLS